MQLQAEREPSDRDLLPTLAGLEYPDVFDINTHLSHISYNHSPDRDNALHSKAVLLGLYQLGATLINSGQAYSGDAVRVEQEGKLKEVTFTTRNREQELLRRGLMARYNQITHDNRYEDPINNVKNPVSLFYILKIALDHLSPGFIVDMFEELSPDSVGVMMAGTPQSFPNGSSLRDPCAAAAILHVYIQNSERVQEILTANNRDKLNQFPSDRFNLILGKRFPKELEDHFCDDYVILMQPQYDARGINVQPETRANIVEDITVYVNKWKFPGAGHNHNERAQRLLDQVTLQNTLEPIKTIISREKLYFEFPAAPAAGSGRTAEDQDFINKVATKPKEESGYFRALQTALTRIDALSKITFVPLVLPVAAPAPNHS